MSILQSVFFPPGYSIRALAADDAPAVAALIAACELADTGKAAMTVEELSAEWQDVDLAEEAVVVLTAAGDMAAYASVSKRSYTLISVYGVDCASAGRGGGEESAWRFCVTLSASSGAAARARRA